MEKMKMGQQFVGGGGVNGKEQIGMRGGGGAEGGC